VENLQVALPQQQLQQKNEEKQIQQQDKARYHETTGKSL